MLAAYRGTPDDEGETLADAVAILRSAMAGAFGPWLPEASFVALDRSGRASGAIVTALEDDGTRSSCSSSLILTAVATASLHC